MFGSGERKQQTPFVLTARLVLDLSPKRALQIVANLSEDASRR
jgi:hypothetical protein